MSQTVKETRSRDWCFTLNNPSVDDVKCVEQIEHKYLIYGKEVGEMGTPHLQGYIEFGNAKRLSTLKKINNKIHWEQRKGTAEQAAEYCKKEGAYKESGLISSSRQGKRNDLEEAVETTKKKGIMGAVLENPVAFVKYFKGLERLDFYLQSKRNSKPEVYWLWGKTGTGKTRKAIEMSPDSFYMKGNHKWWDGYLQQKCIIVDDFDGLWPFRDLLNFLDRYPYQGQTKGGFVHINSPIICVTCEHAPSYFWRDTDLEQVLRRCTHVTEVNGNTNVHFNKENDIKRADNICPLTPASSHPISPPLNGGH